ncbi:hypothetical protein C0993_000429, partial [Termitomyces sp. T159_Od127]
VEEREECAEETDESNEDNASEVKKNIAIATEKTEIAGEVEHSVERIEEVIYAVETVERSLGTAEAVEADRDEAPVKTAEQNVEVTDGDNVKKEKVTQVETMGRIDNSLTESKEAKEKWEREKEENEKVLKEIELAQSRIGKLLDLEKARGLVSRSCSGLRRL